MSTPVIEMKNISKYFTLDSGSEIKALQGINLSLALDEAVAILGPSGCGKSTCLRLMCGLLSPDEGQVLSNGKQLEGTNYDVSLVFQQYALFPWETVYRNIEMAISHLDLSEEEQRARVKKAIDLVGLEGFEEAYPRELAGGMKQRVGIARALVMERPILFLDEPFSSLDVLTADTMRFEMLNIWQAKNTSVKTILLVSHNIHEAVYMAKRILVMGSNPGVIRNEIYNDLPYPRDERSPAFQKMVTHVHEVIAETVIPDQPAVTPLTAVSPKVVKEPPIETIPNVQIGEMVGLVEAIADEAGNVDIFELGNKIGKDYGSTLYLVKAAELLDLVDTPKHMVVLTELGKRFVDGDINARKRILHELFGALRIVQLTTNLLRAEENLRMPIETLLERIAEWLPNENPDTIAETLIMWGRFSEYFGYNDDTKELYLDVGQETA